MNNPFYQSIRQIILESRKKITQTINIGMVETYWLVGKHIVKEEQNGKHRAEYGKNLLGYLSENLSNEVGKGFDKSNLSNMRKFYTAFPILDAVRQELSWTHYRQLLRLENPKARTFYVEETVANGWSTRVLNRQINSLY